IAGSVHAAARISPSGPPWHFPVPTKLSAPQSTSTPTRTSTRGLHSSLTKLTIDHGPMGERRCAMDRAAARPPPQRDGGRPGGVEEGEDEKTVRCSNSEASRGRDWHRWRNDRCACFHHMGEQFVARI